MTRSFRSERGAALVEFALVLPVFLLTVGVAMAVVWLVGARSAVTGAVRDGARYASIQHDWLDCTAPCPTGYPTQDEVEKYVVERAGVFGVDSVTVSPAARYRNEVITVTARRQIPNPFRAMTSVIGLEDVVYSTTVKVRSE